MRRLLLLLNAILLCCHQAYSQAVVAHFMIGNVPNWDQVTWENDIRIAQEAHIDGFVLNMAESDPKLRESISTAFNAAAVRNFQLMFSFDYAGGIPEGSSWKDKATVIQLINEYKGRSTYLRHKGKPIVSTFEGPLNAPDWNDIKAQTGIVFLPSYSSLGAQAAMKTGVPDGLFSWAGWPWGNTNMDAYVDESYRQFLDGRDYMMPVSPWFYTNMPGFNKNWLWRGDSLWFDRWRDVHVLKPALVQIITWNDWGESHYIGPLREGTYGAFDVGKAPYNYAENMPHDGWRLFLPFVIDTYKYGKGTVTHEGVVAWYRKHPKSACNDGGTTANTASQLQLEFTPADVVQDKIFYSALLGSGGGTRWVQIHIDGVEIKGEFQHIPDGYIGLYHGSADTGGRTGTVRIAVRRDARDIAVVDGIRITSDCQNGLQNYNAWVGYDKGRPITPIQPALALSEQECIAGKGAGNFNEICGFTCKYGYCPAACHCTKLGKPSIKPKTTELIGYPAPHLNQNYAGLCNVACNLDKGWCTSDICSLNQTGPFMPTGPSPFLPGTCRGGTGRVALDDTTCEWTCLFAHCPIHLCKCTTPGSLELHQSPDFSKKCVPKSPNADNKDYKNLCKFSGERHRCEGPCHDPTPPPVKENKCEPADQMYSSEVMPQGEIELMSPDGTKLNWAENTDGHQWVTIVNLTPYKMIHIKGPPDPYQFETWDFGDIPSGKARKNEATYDTGLNVRYFVDTNGFANYRLEGTSKTFQIHVTTHIPDGHERRVVFDLGGMGMGWRELAFPGEGLSVALVITGSEEFGYVNSLQLNDIAWMDKMYDIIKDRQLRHVIVPGAHDGAMSGITNSGWWNGGIAANTATQSLDHYNQLRVGTRYFDMRIVSVKGDKFWSAHVNEELDASPFGATGESLDDLIAGVNRFTTDYPGEVIVWVIRYMVDLDSGRLNKEARYWSEAKLDEFYDKLETINNPCKDLTNTPNRFDKQPMRNFLDKNDGKGCVLLITRGALKAGREKGRIESGIYPRDDYLRDEDYWAEQEFTRGNADKQLTKMAEIPRDDSEKDNYFIMQWQCTPKDFGPPRSLNMIANQETNPALYHYAVQAMKPDSFPTVILHDAVGLFHIGDLKESAYNPMMQTLVIGLNLYMVPQNCKVSKIKHPLLESKKQMKGGKFASSGFTVFTGVVFANGTVLEETPRDFCRTCTFNDTTSIDHPLLNTTSNSTASARVSRIRRTDLSRFM